MNKFMENVHSYHSLIILYDFLNVSFIFNKLRDICLGGDVSSVSVVVLPPAVLQWRRRRARQRQADARPEAGPWLGPGQCSVCQVPGASTLTISSFLPTFLPSEDDAQVYAAAV